MKVLFVYFLLLISFVSYGQPQDSQRQIGSYDPSFWKKELKLDRFQYVRMCEINREFYDRLIEAFRVLKDDRKAFHSAFAQCWVNRNTQLLQTMNIRQQKKWNKIMTDKYHVENTQASVEKGSEIELILSLNDSLLLDKMSGW